MSLSFLINKNILKSNLQTKQNIMEAISNILCIKKSSKMWKILDPTAAQQNRFMKKQYSVSKISKYICKSYMN